MTGLPPRWYEVLLGCLAVLAGCIAAAAAVRAGRRTGNWLYHVRCAGAVVFVVGVAGQRSFPTAEQLRRLGSAASTSPPGPWEAGVRLPWIGVSLTPVALGGLLLASLGLSLLLFFDPVAAVAEAHEPACGGRLEDEDSA
ncbi:MAG: hypothetical protein ABR564_06735 [Candidatus Dormibacteria bacterium]